MTFQPMAIGRLATKFLWHCIFSGLITARMILLRQSTTAGLVKMEYQPMNSTGVAILAAMVTLTPGSSAVDIDLVRREILLHLLDLSTAEQSIAAIRRDFEQDIRKLFPKEER